MSFKLIIYYFSSKFIKYRYMLKFQTKRIPKFPSMPVSKKFEADISHSVAKTWQSLRTETNDLHSFANVHCFSERACKCKGKKA